ncbi:MAG: hypothetical protein SFW65_01425 [Alphaproteobacteria bacterium]|nr:hypothetical protein [Alphaproteobacteria bacterium]
MESAALTTHPARLVSMAALAAALIYFAGVNLFSDFRPVVNANDTLAIQLNQATALRMTARVARFAELLQRQEALLVENPIEPYAWMRLSYLRLNTGDTRQSAFDALRFADKIAQPDNVGGMERILMWHDYADIHTDADKEREVQMWRKAYRGDWDNLYNVIAAHRLHHVFDKAIEGDPQLLAKLNKTRKH